MSIILMMDLQKEDQLQCNVTYINFNHNFNKI